MLGWVGLSGLKKLSTQLKTQNKISTHENQNEMLGW